MNRFIEKMESLAKRIHLDPGRKAAIRTELVRRMTASPVEAESVRAPIFRWRNIWAPAVSFAAILVIAGSGTSLAAEYALPGDPLYPIKTDFNEPLIGLLNNSPALKAAWQVRLTERRLEEADKLALQGKLNDQTRAVVAANLEKTATNAQQAIASLTAQGNADQATDVSARLESSLKAHDAILAKLDDGHMPGLLRKQIAAALSGTVAVNGEAESKLAEEDGGSGGEVVASSKIGNASSLISSVQDYLNEQKSLIGDSASAAASARMAVAEDFLTKAKDFLNSNDYGQAIKYANQSMRAAQETRVLASAQVDAAQTLAAAAPADTGGGAAAGTTMSAMRVDFLATSSDDDFSTSTDERASTTATSTAVATSTATSTPLHVDGGDVESP